MADGEMPSFSLIFFKISNFFVKRCHPFQKLPSAVLRICFNSFIYSIIASRLYRQTTQSILIHVLNTSYKHCVFLTHSLATNLKFRPKGNFVLFVRIIEPKSNSQALSLF